MLGEVAASHKHGLHPLRVWPQRRIGHGEVAPARSKVCVVEPRCLTDFLSREAPVVIWFGRLLKKVRVYEASFAPADKLLRRYTVSPLEGWVHPSIPVIASDDGYEIG